MRRDEPEQTKPCLTGHSPTQKSLRGKGYPCFTYVNRESVVKNEHDGAPDKPYCLGSSPTRWK